VHHGKEASVASIEEVARVIASTVRAERTDEEQILDPGDAAAFQATGRTGTPQLRALPPGRRRERAANKAWQNAEAELRQGRVGDPARGRQTFRRYVQERWLPVTGAAVNARPPAPIRADSRHEDAERGLGLDRDRYGGSKPRRRAACWRSPRNRSRVARVYMPSIWRRSHGA
jgi:hypothetical protein